VENGGDGALVRDTNSVRVLWHSFHPGARLNAKEPDRIPFQFHYFRLNANASKRMQNRSAITKCTYRT